MAIKFENRLKGSLTQSLVCNLLSSAGYRVVPLGVEEVILEIQNLPYEQYQKLEVPKNLRTLPDFFVTDLELTASVMLEVKYRKAWTQKSRDSLAKTLLEQTKFWQPLYVALFLGESAGDGDHHDDYMRVAKLSYKDGTLWHRVDQPTGPSIEKPFTDLAWSELWSFEETFGKITKLGVEAGLMKIARLVQALPNLDRDD